MALYKPHINAKLPEKADKEIQVASETFTRMACTRFEAHFFQIWGKTLMKKEAAAKRKNAFTILNSWWSDNASDIDGCDYTKVLRIVRDEVQKSLGAD